MGQRRRIMMSLKLFDAHVIRPFACLGLKGEFWGINDETVIYTWIGMLVLFALALIGNWLAKRESGLAYVAFENIVLVFVDLCKESFKTFNFDYFAFIASLFLFTLFSCLVGLMPFLDEATKDLNTTFALGTISFMYVQYQKVHVHGFFGFLKEFAEPFFVLVPINIIGELAKIFSMSFRLFGNILGGSVITMIVINFIGEFKGYFIGYVGFVVLLALFFLYFGKRLQNCFGRKILNVLIFSIFLLAYVNMFFGIFEGLIQSFVITMLTTTYLAIGVQVEDEKEMA